MLTEDTNQVLIMSKVETKPDRTQKSFLSLTEFQYNQEDHTPLSFYADYRERVMEYMKPAGTLLKWKENTVLEIDETISPTFEDHILLTALLLMDTRLPAKIKTIYGPRMEFEGIFLMDLASEIFNYVSKIIEEDKKAGLLLAANANSYDEFDNSFVYYPDMGLEYPVLKTEPYLEDEDSITADIKSNKKFKMDPDFYPEDDFIDDTGEPFKPAITKKKKKKIKKRKNSDGSERPIGRPRKKIKTEDGEKPEPTSKFGKMLKKAKAQHQLQVQEWKKNDMVFVAAQAKLREDMSNFDNWEDPKKLWYKYHEFNKDIYLFKNQENQDKKPKFVCPLCKCHQGWANVAPRKTMDFFEHLRGHMWSFKYFQCQCFPEDDDWHNHQKGRESKEKIKERADHVKLVHWNWIRCPHCPEVVENEVFLGFHMDAEHKDLDNPYLVCQKCPKPKQFRRFAFKEHMDEHLNEKIGIKVKRERCELCLAIFMSDAHRSYHDEVVHGPQFGCTLYNVNKERCYFYCRTPKEMEVHKAESHANTQPPTKEQPSKNLVCDLCGHVSKNQSGFHNHKNTHGDKLQCPHCPKKFIPVALNAHIKKVHSEPVVCTECGAKVKNLAAHMVQHIPPDKMKFRCTHCEKGFMDKQKMNNHIMSVHLKERPYPCRYGCDIQAYNDVSNRNQHEKKNHGQLFTLALKATTEVGE